MESRFRNIFDFFEDAGVVPKFIDAHLYGDFSTPLDERAKYFVSIAANHALPFVVGETQINRPDILQVLVDVFLQALIRPEAIVHWPVKFRSFGCAADQDEVPQ